MSEFDVMVRNHLGASGATVQIDLGALAGDLTVNVDRTTDRFRRVHVRWARRAGNEPTTVGFGYLDTREGDICSPEEVERRTDQFSVHGYDLR